MHKLTTILPCGSFFAVIFRVLVGVLVSVQADAQAGAVQRVERGALVMENIPETTAELAGKLERYLNGRQATFLDWTPEGGILIATRFGDVEQVHLVEQPLGMRRQLTFYNEPVTTARHAPHGVQKGFIFLKDVGGNEYAQIYFYAKDTGEARLLTDGRSLNGSAVWSNDGRQLAFFSTKRNGVSHDVYVVDPSAAAEPRLVAALDGGAWYPLDWSPDNRFLLVKNFISINKSHLFTVDVSTGAKRRILPAKQDERLGIGDARFAKDRHGIYVAHDQDGEFKQLRFVRLPDTAAEPDKPGKLESQLLSGHIPWDVETFDLSSDDR